MNRRIGVFVVLVSSTLLLTSCSVTLRGIITDIVTDLAITDAKVTVQIDPERTREAGVDEEGKYRIKKDDKPQDVAYTAPGFESYTTNMEKVKEKDVYLVPTPEETARRIVQGMMDKNYDEVYRYLHPNYQGLFTQEKFRSLNENDFATMLDKVTEFRIAETVDKETYKDEILTKTYVDVKAITAVMVMGEDVPEGEEAPEFTWEINLIKMRDQNSKEYWHWIFNRTTNT